MNILLSLSLSISSHIISSSSSKGDFIHYFHYFRSLSSSKRSTMCVCLYVDFWGHEEIYSLVYIHVQFSFTNDVIHCLYNLIIVFHVIDTYDNGLNWYNRWISSLDVSHFLLEVRIDHLCPHSSQLYYVKKYKNPAVAHTRCRKW